jgi:hypothetical protein
MGRTVQPYSRQIQQLADERLSDFRRALPRDDQEAFDEIFRIGKSHLASGVMAANPYSLETVLLSNLIRVRMEMAGLQKKLQNLEESISDLRENCDNMLEVREETHK